jgi:hypothetical protein
MRRAHPTFWHILLKSLDDVPSPRASGERDKGEGHDRSNLLRMNLPSSKAPPLPNPLLHKQVEEREIDKAGKNEMRPLGTFCPVLHPTIVQARRAVFALGAMCVFGVVESSRAQGILTGT